MQELGLTRAKLVTEPVACRICKNKCAITRWCKLNKLIRPCKCKPICELCYANEISENQAQVHSSQDYKRYICPRCRGMIYFRPEFEAEFISVKQLKPDERCIFWILTISAVLVLAFGLITLISSVALRSLWVGLVVFFVCIIVDLMLVPGILNRFTHRFYTKKRVRKGSATQNVSVTSGIFLKDIIE